MPFTLTAKRRISHDIKELNKSADELADIGIYVNMDGDNMNTYYALLIGEDDTPYEGGFYFFKIVIPDNYPIRPPSFTFLSTQSGVRIHPNLYTEGKVCLSIINTWEGDGWVASYSIKTLLMNIKSYIFVKHPLHNEPGYEEDSEEEGGVVATYSKFVTYHNVRGCINYILEHLHSSLSSFKPIIESIIRKNSKKYFDYINNLRTTAEGTTIYSGAYSGMNTMTADYENQFNKFATYCEKIGL